jgi:hypothetical protein
MRSPLLRVTNKQLDKLTTKAWLGSAGPPAAGGAGRAKNRTKHLRILPQREGEDFVPLVA